jgi:hypothetical protein
VQVQHTIEMRCRRFLILSHAMVYVKELFYFQTYSRAACDDSFGMNNFGTLLFSNIAGCRFSNSVCQLVIIKWQCLVLLLW